MSRRRQAFLFRRYSLSPVRYSRRLTATSLHGTERTPSLVKVSSTSARPTALREAEPWKMRSSMRWPRSDFALCSPSAQRTASLMLDLPQPFGPTMPVMPGRTFTTVRSAKDLKPPRTMDSRRMGIDITAPREPPRENTRDGGHDASHALNLDAGWWSYFPGVHATCRRAQASGQGGDGDMTALFSNVDSN